ncbi:MAG: hypothetical protein QOD60_2032, partial [Solirubrobacterales bacterium]|nr:hypothetical protein [Solirubrobacterales bacterium]
MRVHSIRRICRVLATAGLLLVLGVLLQASQAAAIGFSGKWGSTGSAPGQFNNPTAVAVGPSGNVYVSDAANNRVQEFSPNGAFINAFGTTGTGPGQFKYPWGIAIDRFGNVYVADNTNDRIEEFTAGGTFINQFGGTGTTDGKFTNPVAISIGPSGNVYVSDQDNRRIQVYTPGGAFITNFGGPDGSLDGQFVFNEGIAVTGSG